VHLRFVGEFTKFVEMGDDYFGPIDQDNNDSGNSASVTIGSKMNLQPFGRILKMMHSQRILIFRRSSILK